MSWFDAIRSERAPRPAQPPAIAPSTPAPPASGRTGKKPISGDFSREMSRSLHLLGLEQGASLQALIGEAFDDLLAEVADED